MRKFFAGHDARTGRQAGREASGNTPADAATRPARAHVASAVHRRPARRRPASPAGY